MNNEARKGCEHAVFFFVFAKELYEFYLVRIGADFTRCRRDRKLYLLGDERWHLREVA